MSKAFIDFENVWLAYNEELLAQENFAVEDINLSVKQGEFVAIVGPSGAGKSTILKVISGLLPPTSGEVRLAGRMVNGASADQLARIGLCTIPEGRGVFPNLSVRENLWMATMAGVPLAQVEETAYARFPRLGERRKQLAGTLSGGEQQMLSMARALSVNPSVLLLDELSMGLAPLVVANLYEIVAQVSQEGVSILVSEQFARTVLGIAQYAAIVLHGNITRVGTPAELEDELSAAYLGS